MQGIGHIIIGFCRKSLNRNWLERRRKGREGIAFYLDAGSVWAGARSGSEVTNPSGQGKFCLTGTKMMQEL